MHQTIHPHAIPPTIPDKNNEDRRQHRRDDCYSLGRMWSSLRLLYLHADQEALATDNARCMHGSRQILLRSPNPQYCHRRYHPCHAHAHRLETSHFPCSKDRSFWNFHRGTLVGFLTEMDIPAGLLMCHRTLIFDIIRLVALIDLSTAGDDITCKWNWISSITGALTPRRHPGQLKCVDMH